MEAVAPFAKAEAIHNPFLSKKSVLQVHPSPF